MNNEYIISSLDNIGEVAEQFAKYWLDKSKIFVFDAPMGSGKTTFIKALCEYLDVQDVINSPTFSIINEYYSNKLDDIVYHFDCYRLSKIDDAINLGAEDYIYSNRYCFIEWADVIADILPSDIVRVKIEELPDGSRQLSCSQD